MIGVTPLTTSADEPEGQRGRLAGDPGQGLGLQRAFVKLLFSFRGQDPSLDARLKRLGQAIKTAPKSIAVLTLIDEVVEQITEITQRSPDVTGVACQLANFLGQIRLDPESGAQGRALQLRLAGARTQDELERLSRASVQLINHQLHDREIIPEPGETGSGNAPLSRLLHLLETENQLAGTVQNLRHRLDEARTQRACLDLAEETATALSFALQNTIASLPPDNVALCRRLLAEIFKAIEPLGHHDRSIENVRGRIEAAENEMDLVVAARQLGGGLKSQRLGYERELKELSEFLARIVQRVEELSTNLRHSGYTHENTVKKSVEMQHALQGQMKEMRERVVEEEEINELKLFVADQLVKIEDSIDQHVKAEGVRQQDARVHVAETLRRLSELEHEMAQLQNDFDEQHSLNLIDPLTGAYNRLGYMEGIQQAYLHWTRSGGDLSLVIFDLDLFKNINDQFGHSTGDKVLISVAGLMRKHIRGVDLICRCGGEEFVLVMPDVDIESAARVAEKLRAAIGSSQFRFKDEPVPVTVSCGISHFRDGDTVEDVFERTDRALYRAKNLGRNRCCIDDGNKTPERLPLEAVSRNT